jgi:hypothetical protein
MAATRPDRAQLEPMARAADTPRWRLPSDEGPGSGPEHAPGLTDGGRRDCETAGDARGGLVMPHVRFDVPAGYRVVTTDPGAAVECDRGCGWTLPVMVLSGMPADIRDELFRYHRAWHGQLRLTP